MSGSAATESGSVASYIDTTRPSIARVYDATLGGKDNYEVDREICRKIEEVAPRQSDVARMNRRWLIRVVRYMADVVGINQFLDCGAGLPTVENTHEVAQRHDPEKRVVYVDNDPVCNAYGRALLEENDYTHFIAADLTQPDTLLVHPEVVQHLDLTQPIGLIFCGVLHHVDDVNDPVGIVRQYVDKLVPGSYVAITHFWDPADENPELHQMSKELERRFTTLGLGSGWYRNRQQITALFGDLDMVDPGVTELDDWWPDGPPRERHPEERLLLGGLARKP
jgi:hypothetical protein